MEKATHKEVRKLVGQPLSFAMMMNDREIEKVIVVFVSVLNKDRPDRGGQD